jgi:pyrimidine and pyridine-specific 5'-nucleotidase
MGKDDSYINTKAAEALGWHSAHIVEPSQLLPTTPSSKYQIRSLEELRDVFPQFFKKANGYINGEV